MIADIKYDGMDIEAKIVRKALNLYSVEILSPETLKGMTVDYDGEEFIFKYMGLSFKSYPAALPDESFLKALFGSFNEISIGDKVTVRQSGNTFIADGTTDYGGFEIAMDTAGNLKEIKIKDIDLAAVIKEFKAID